MLITLYDDSLSPKQLSQAVNLLENDSILLVPTDTLYAFVCYIHSRKAAHRLAEIKGKKLEKSNFSILCSSLSMASNYIKPLSNHQFSFIKSLDSGKFTLVLQASSLTPKIFQNKKRTIGVRITQNPMLINIIEQLNHPLLVTSAPRDNDTDGIYKNAELIYEKYEDDIALAIDRGEIASIPSTVLDMTSNEDYDIIRQGLGVVE